MKQLTFIAVLASAIIAAGSMVISAQDTARDYEFRSSFLHLKLIKDFPQFSYFSVNSLGKGNIDKNPVLDPDKSLKLKYVSNKTKNLIEYRQEKNSGSPKSAWSVEFSDKVFKIRSNFNPGDIKDSFEIGFSQKLNHATSLGIMKEKNKMKFPCVLHLPDMGSIRITCSSKDAEIYYGANRNCKVPYVKFSLLPADEKNKSIEYTFEVAAIYPESEAFEKDSRFDGFRRNFINIFQMNPNIMILSNNSASDPCALTLFKYSEVALHTPSLASGLSAFDLIRLTLDRYLDGYKSYAMTGYADTTSYGYGYKKFHSLDTYPSLIISCCNYVKGTNDKAWLKKNYSKILSWANEMISQDKNGNGLIEYGYSGNSGSWIGTSQQRPANWWDCIGFGYEDAYSNALAYKTYAMLAELCGLMNDAKGKEKFINHAAEIKKNYFNTFYNKETGVLAGWKSQDGKLHDYWFTFVNGIAIYYGLIEKDKANQIMDRILEKLKDLNYTNFELGLPGNLVSVRREDYTDRSKRFGGGDKEDGSDAFQRYENGGATGCFVYYTIEALYKLNRNKDAEMILFPVLKSYDEGNFEGHCSNGMSKDWKTWNGECWGYEGFLVDNYLAVLSALHYK